MRPNACGKMAKFAKLPASGTDLIRKLKMRDYLLRYALARDIPSEDVEALRKCTERMRDDQIRKTHDT
jgi:hypothetical protein